MTTLPFDCRKQAERHHALELINTRFKGEPVSRAGLTQYIQCVKVDEIGGGIEVVIWLKGDPTAYAPSDITIPGQPK